MRWYDVNKRLPNRELERHMKMYPGSNEVQVICAVKGWKKSVALFWDGETFCDELSNICPVTHWMPMPALPDDCTNPYGTWLVFTEQSETDWRPDQIGVYDGYVDEIALALAGRATKSLFFRRWKAVEPWDGHKRDRTEICVYEAEVKRPEGCDRVEHYKEMLYGSDVQVSESKLKRTVTLRKPAKENVPVVDNPNS